VRNQALSKTVTIGRYLFFTYNPAFFSTKLFSLINLFFLNMYNFNNQTHQREDNAEAI